MKNKALLLLSSICLAFLLLVPQVNASESKEIKDINQDNVITYDQYLDYVKEGIVGEDVSYEDLKKINEDDLELEKQLENDSNFYRAALTLQPGDIIISNSTSSAGLTGHSGIAISSNSILHIGGPSEKVTTPTRASFVSRYNKGWIKVYRYKNSSSATKAANWAKSKYMGSNAKYKITTNLATTSETYCSKIVWQAYYYGAGSSTVTTPLTVGIRTPYSLPQTIRDVSLKGEI